MFKLQLPLNPPKATVPVLLILDHLGRFLETEARHLEGHLVVAHFIEQHPQTPNVQGQRLVLVGEDFGRKVLPSPANGVPPLVPDDSTRKPEIRDFGRVLLVEQNVLGLEVAVQNAQRVDVLDAPANVAEDEGHLLVAESALPLHVVEQGALRRVLQHQVDEVAFAQDLVQADDVFVVELRVDFDFLLDVLELLRLELFLVYLVKGTDFKANRWRVGVYSTRETVEE